MCCEAHQRIAGHVSARGVTILAVEEFDGYSLIVDGVSTVLARPQGVAHEARGDHRRRPRFFIFSRAFHSRSGVPIGYTPHGIVGSALGNIGHAAAVAPEPLRKDHVAG